MAFSSSEDSCQTHVAQVVSQLDGRDCEVPRWSCGSSSVCTRLQLQDKSLEPPELLGKFFVVHIFSACCTTSYKSLVHLETTMSLHQWDAEGQADWLYVNNYLWIQKGIKHYMAFPKTIYIILPFLSRCLMWLQNGTNPRSQEVKAISIL